MGLIGQYQTLRAGDDLRGWSVIPLPAETEIWESREIAVPLPVPRPVRWYWQVAQEPWPVRAE